MGRLWKTPHKEGPSDGWIYPICYMDQTWSNVRSMSGHHKKGKSNNFSCREGYGRPLTKRDPRSWNLPYFLQGPHLSERGKKYSRTSFIKDFWEISLHLYYPTHLIYQTDSWDLKSARNIWLFVLYNQSLSELVLTSFHIH